MPRKPFLNAHLSEPRSGHAESNVVESREQRERGFHNKSFEAGTRRVVGKYYSIVRSSHDFYQSFLKSHCRNKRVLEYGCGPGSHSFFLARYGAIVTGIDISDVAIRQARQKAENERLEIDFREMNAEKLEFEDATFDLVCGTGILHHLDIHEAFPQLTRTLKPDGTAIFLEPLGHNPLIKLYRWLTPHLRTEDEHPLLVRDFCVAKEYFEEVATHFFHFTSLAAFPFRRLSLFPNLLRALDLTDRSLFRWIPFTRRYSWVVVIILSQPSRARST